MLGELDLLAAERGQRQVGDLEVGDGARRVASFLIEEGVKPGDHVGIWAGNRAEWHTADAAILLIRGLRSPAVAAWLSEE